MSKHVIQFGGAIFSGQCPHRNCKKVVKPHGLLSVNLFMNILQRKQVPTGPAVCGKCGVVRVPFLKFAS